MATPTREDTPMIQPGPCKYVLETSEPEQHSFGGEFDTREPDTEDNILGWLLGIHLPELKGQSVTVARFELTPRRNR